MLLHECFADYIHQHKKNCVGRALWINVLCAELIFVHWKTSATLVYRCGWLVSWLCCRTLASNCRLTTPWYRYKSGIKMIIYCLKRIATERVRASVEVATVTVRVYKRVKGRVSNLCSKALYPLQVRCWTDEGSHDFLGLSCEAHPGGNWPWTSWRLVIFFSMKGPGCWENFDTRESC